MTIGYFHPSTFGTFLSILGVARPVLATEVNVTQYESLRGQEQSAKV